MENFFNHIQSQRDDESQTGQEGPSVDSSLLIQLETFKKEVILRKSWIEEFALDGEFDTAMGHVAWLGNELSKIYSNLEKMEKEDCGCDDKKEE